MRNRRRADGQRPSEDRLAAASASPARDLDGNAGHGNQGSHDADGGKPRRPAEYLSGTLLNP